MLFSTRKLIESVVERSPELRISEEDVRYAIRLGRLARPQVVAGRYVWAESDVDRVIAALTPDEQRPEAHDDVV